MLSIKNLSIKTREKILEDFSFSFENGYLYGIVAKNGSGKTTFYRGVMGLIPIESGKISTNAKTCDDKKDFFYYETSDWFDLNLSGWDYLRFVKNEWASKASIEDIVQTWGMTEYIKLPIKKYSLGMKQRVLIAMYLVSQAQYLLMDEITNGLDESSRQLLFTELLKLKKENKMIIISSHYKEDIEEHCDYLLTIENLKMAVKKL